MHYVKKKKRNRFPIRLLSYLIVAAAFFCLGRFLPSLPDKPAVKDILLVNENHTLPADWVPSDLVNLYEFRHSFRLANASIELQRECYEAAQRMFAAAEADAMNGYIITSGYRSYERQIEIYAETEAGKAQKPGASEHQTGLAFDVTVESSGKFESTEQYEWLCKHAHEYGFIQRYPAGKESITGISYEPWHYRYVGEAAARAIKKKGVTLEEYLV